jgi:flagellin-like hook-associated protein FlgL
MQWNDSIYSLRSNALSSLSPLSTSTLQNTINTSQQQINDILKTLQTGLSINSASDDPSNLYISDKLNSQALDAATTSSNAQNGLTYLQIAQKAYSDIISELDKIKTIANNAMSTSYSDAQLQEFQDSITESINKIKDIEENTTFNGVQVFNNSNSAGSVNEHMFAVTSKTAVTVTTVTLDANRGTDFSSYLTNTINRYIKQPDGTLVNGVDPDLTIGSNVIAIETADQLIAALDNQNSLGKTYVLLENIDLSALGTKTESLLRGTFEGTLLGNGYAITGLNINSTSSHAGLFEVMNGNVQDLILKDFNIQGGDDVGALAAEAGSLASVIDNVAVLDSNLSSDFSTGGLVGVNFATIKNSYSTGQVSGDALSTNIGGLVGHHYKGTILNSFSSANVTGGTNVGGLVGNTEDGTTITESYARGTVSGITNVGGLVGIAGAASITNTYALGNVSGQADASGLVGNNSGTISTSYSLSQVTDTTTTYDVNSFVTTSTGETVQGTAARPNDTYNLVYDWGGKTWAFSSVQDFNAFSNSNGTVGQFYELTDAVNNIWTGRTQQANAETYSSNLLGTSVASLPDSTFGTFNVTDSGYSGFAFASVEDLEAYKTGNGEISIFYEYNSGTEMWDAYSQVLNAGSGDYNYTMSGSMGVIDSTVVDPGDDYNILRNIGGYDYAFATETDANNFGDGSNDPITGFQGTIGKFYQLNGSNLWDSYSVTASTSTAPTTYGVSTLSTGIQNIPDDSYTYTTTGLDGKKYAFSSAADLAKFGNGTNISGNIASFYRLESDGYWDAVRTTQTAASTSLISQGTSVDNETGYYNNYTFQKTLASGMTYAFSSAADLAKLNDDGTFSGTVGTYYTNNQNNNPSQINQWTPMNATTANNVTTWDWSKTPEVALNNTYAMTYQSSIVSTVDAPLDDYNVLRNINGDNYAFATVTDANNFNDGVNFLGNIGKFYRENISQTWDELEVYSVSTPGTTTYSVATASTGISNIPDDAYTFSTVGADGKKYAFSSAADMTKFGNGTNLTGTIGNFYRLEADGLWDALSVTSTSDPATYNVSNVTTGVSNMPDNTNATFITTGADGKKYAFLTNADMTAFGNGTNITADIASFYRLEDDGKWDEVSASPGVGVSTLTSLAYPSLADTVGYYNNFYYQTTLADGTIYAFSSSADRAKLKANGTFTGSVALYYTNYQNDVQSESNIWNPMSATTYNSTTTYDWMADYVVDEGTNKPLAAKYSVLVPEGMTNHYVDQISLKDDAALYLIGDDAMSTSESFTMYWKEGIDWYSQDVNVVEFTQTYYSSTSAGASVTVNPSTANSLMDHGGGYTYYVYCRQWRYIRFCKYYR